MKRRTLALVVFLFVVNGAAARASSPSLLVFAGAASKPPSEEIVKIFEQRTGVKVNVTYGGSGFVLSQMKLARRGDLYFPGSSDFMEKSKQEGVVFPESERIIAYLVPAINVPKGNPQGIHSLRDLLAPGLRLAIADPESVCVGLYAVEVIEKNLLPEERKRLRRNIVNTVESCEKTANIVSLKGVDAVIGWEVFGHWDPERIETVLLKAEEIPRIGYIPAAISRFTRNRSLAETFLRFLSASEAASVFRRHGYLMSVHEARQYALPQTPVGGGYALPEEWKRKK